MTTTRRRCEPLRAVRDRIVLLTGDGAPLCERCTIAAGPWSRMRGLLGRSSLPADEGLLLRPCSSIHTWFLRFAIDVVFLDGNLTVLDVRNEVRPGRLAWHRGAAATLELAAGACARAGLRPGDRLAWGSLA